jgi:tRNA (mo5U34)-methyltransferase
LSETSEAAPSRGAGAEAIPDLYWWHCIELGDGRVTPGHKALDVLKAEAEVIFRHGVEGRTVLDIGAWDGFFSFEAERRGAARVVAADKFCWDGGGIGSKRAFDFARRQLRSKVESEVVDLFELAPEKLGRFDVVLFLGVLYHLKNPFGGLERAAAMTSDLLVVETVLGAEWVKTPVMQFHAGAALSNDPTNFFTPNVLCLQAMLRDIGFRRIEVSPHPTISAAPIRNWYGKVKLQPLGRTIVHAWR